MPDKGNLEDVRARVKSGKLTDGDRKFLDALLTQADQQGLGEKVGNRRVVARLPNGMDIVK
jgi:hypothetical protein